MKRVDEQGTPTHNKSNSGIIKLFRIITVNVIIKTFRTILKKISVL